jgi:hypothetical protein
MNKNDILSYTIQVKIFISLQKKLDTIVTYLDSFLFLKDNILLVALYAYDMTL